MLCEPRAKNGSSRLVSRPHRDAGFAPRERPLNPSGAPPHTPSMQPGSCDASAWASPAPNGDMVAPFRRVLYEPALARG
jgi:hypothetical protein